MAEQVDPKSPLNSKTVIIGTLLTLLAWLADNMDGLAMMLPADVFRYIALYGPPMFVALRFISTGVISFNTPFKIPLVPQSPPADPPK